MAAYQYVGYYVGGGGVAGADGVGESVGVGRFGSIGRIGGGGDFGGIGSYHWKWHSNITVAASAYGSPFIASLFAP